MATSNIEYLTIKSACQMLGVSQNTLRSWGAAGKVAEYRHPMNNYRLFKRQDIEELRSKLLNPHVRTVTSNPSLTPVKARAK